MKNILIVNCVFDPEPVVSAQIGKSLALSIYERGESVTVIAPYPSRPMGFKFDNKIVSSKKKNVINHGRLKIFNLPSFVYSKSGALGRLWESISFGKVSFDFIVKSEINYDIVYMNTWPIFGQLGVALACLKTNTPYVIHIMDIYPESVSNKLPALFKNLINLILMPIDKFILKNASIIIAISASMKNYLMQSRGVSGKKISIVQNWQDETDFIKFKSKIKTKNEPFIFMYLGNLGPLAGLEFVIQAFSQSNLIDSKLVLAGSGSMKEKLKKIVEENNFQNIEFWTVSEGMVPEIQNKADILLLPLNKGAGFSSIPSKLPAYMFSSKPVLASVDINTDTGNVIQNANCGWVVEPESIKSLIIAMNDIRRVPRNELERKGENGFKFALKNFSKSENLKLLISSIIEK